jgi:general secretion pathway protein M
MANGVNDVSAPWRAALQPLLAKWAGMAPREQRGVRLAALLVGVALVWTVLLAPALRTLQKAPAQHQALDAELERMLRLQLRARALQSQTAVSAAEALNALQTSIAQLGNGATVRVLGDQVTLTLQQVGAKELAQWLTQPGASLQVQPAEVHLQRDAQGKPSWSGTLTFTLPQGGNAAR